MSWKKRLSGRLPDFADVVRRFPIAVLIMAVFTLWLSVQLISGRINNDEWHVFGGFILCGYIAVIMGLISEARGWKKPKGLMLGISFGLPTFLVCYLAKHTDFNIPMAIAAAIVFLGNAAAFRRARHDSHVWNFTQKLWTGAIFAVVGSWIFAGGMFVISEAVRSLFGANIEHLTYDVLLPVGLAFLAPIYWMGTLPRYGDVENVSELSFEARALSFLGTWMLAPLVIIYSIIILAYGAKVLLQWELPKGEIAMLVTPFLGVGMLVWLMLEPKVLKEGGFVRFYRRIWHWVMLAATVLLAIAVFTRIREYGFTVERVLLTLIVIWGFVQSLWFVFRSKEKRDIRIPTGVAAALLFFGAFAATPLSLEHQYQRAKAAKSTLSILNAETAQKNPEAAKVFLGGLKFLIKHRDEKRFERLLPNAQMPFSVYGAKYGILLESLGLDGVVDGQPQLYSGYSIHSESRIAIDTKSHLYGSYKIRLFKDGRRKMGHDIITKEDGLVIELTIEGETYPVDFETVIVKLNLLEEAVPNKPVKIGPLQLTSKTGKSASLLILNGNIGFNGRVIRDVSLDIALIVPN